MELSIIIPTYNEAKNIHSSIESIEQTIKKITKNFEIIVVDDSSPDGTANVAESLNSKYGNIKVIVRKNKEGIGAALREGYDSALGEIIISTDADLSFESKDMLRLIDEVNNGYDLVVGSRHILKGSYERGKYTTWVKWVISYLGNKLVKTVSGVNVRDFTANFRAIKKEVWKSIKLKEKTNSLLLEMIMKVHYKGYKIKEVQVTFKDRIHGKSKLNIFMEAPKFFLKLLYFTFELRILKKGRT